MTRRQVIDRIALILAWVVLIGVNVVNANRINDLVVAVDTEVAATAEQVCGSWLGTYQMLSAWAAEGLGPKTATDVRERFAADFNQHCSDYEQTLP